MSSDSRRVNSLTGRRDPSLPVAAESGSGPAAGQTHPSWEYRDWPHPGYICRGCDSDVEYLDAVRHRCPDSSDSPPVTGEVPRSSDRALEGERTRDVDPGATSQRGASQAPGELVRDQAGGGDTAPLGVAPPTEPGLEFPSSPVDPERDETHGETRGASLSGLRSVSGDDSFPVLPGRDIDGKSGVDAGSGSCSSGDLVSTPYIDFRKLIPRLREVGWSPAGGAGNPFGEVRGYPFRRGAGR